MKYQGFDIIENEDRTFSVPELDAALTSVFTMPIFHTYKEVYEYIDWYLATY